jgi:truncated hemoglobin YjbI
MSVFEKYGGFAKIIRIVSAFYDKVLESAVLASYFTVRVALCSPIPGG